MSLGRIRKRPPAEAASSLLFFRYCSPTAPGERAVRAVGIDGVVAIGEQRAATGEAQAGAVADHGGAIDAWRESVRESGGDGGQCLARLAPCNCLALLIAVELRRPSLRLQRHAGQGGDHGHHASDTIGCLCASAETS
jgi:hypothetical protein